MAPFKVMHSCSHIMSHNLRLLRTLRLTCTHSCSNFYKIMHEAHPWSIPMLNCLGLCCCLFATLSGRPGAAAATEGSLLLPVTNGWLTTSSMDMRFAGLRSIIPRSRSRHAAAIVVGMSTYPRLILSNTPFMVLELRRARTDRTNRCVSTRCTKKQTRAEMSHPT